MRFFFYDGKAIQGPLEIPELLKQPGFGSGTLVCPAGSQRTSDWKPVADYAVLKESLAHPPPPAGPAPPAQAPTLRCPSCSHSNPDDAAFCNRCGARVDGKQEGMDRPLRLGDELLGPGLDAPTMPITMPVSETVPAAQALETAPPTEAPGLVRRFLSKRLLLAVAASCVLIAVSATAYILYKKRASRAAPPAAAPAPEAPGPKAQAPSRRRSVPKIRPKAPLAQPTPLPADKDAKDADDPWADMP
ncbi:MAG: zinc ribbon domain-containing protein [Elusimicrobia bacterium]|nr:zinc ribbon domain-containing protein [Elusimicrobiota bacterium]